LGTVSRPGPRECQRNSENYTTSNIAHQSLDKDSFRLSETQLQLPLCPYKAFYYYRKKTRKKIHQYAGLKTEISQCWLKISLGILFKDAFQKAEGF